MSEPKRNLTLALQGEDRSTVEDIIKDMLLTEFDLGQSWGEQTSNRIIGATYTNDTGRPIKVFASMYRAISAERFGIQALVDGVTIGYSLMDPDGLNVYVDVYFDVPDGSTYRINDSGGFLGTLYKWSELR